MPIYEVKPMKKGAKKSLESSDSRNKLEVNTAEVKKKKESSHHRSKERKEEKEQKTSKEKEHKSREHKSKERSEHKSKEKVTVKRAEEEKQKEKTANEASCAVSEKKEVKNEEVNGVGKILREDSTGIGRHVTKYGKNLNRSVKPPVILVFADSVVAKDNVKQVLHQIVNRERYVPVSQQNASYALNRISGIQCMIFH